MSKLRHAFRLPWLVPVIVSLLLSVSTPLAAQTAAAPTLSAEQVEARIKEVEGLPGLDEAQRGRLSEAYRQALAQLEAAKKSESQASAYRAALGSAPKETRAIYAGLDNRGRA